MKRAAVACALLIAGAALLEPMRTLLFNSLTYFPSAGHDATPADAGLAYEDLELVAEDGVRLHAWWLPPAGSAPRWSVLFLHGNGGNISHRLDHARLLTGAGLGVLLLDYRGYGRSDGSPDEQGTYRDARAARRALVALPGVNSERIVYLGESLGGAVAAGLAAEHPPAALVLQSTFTSIAEMARLHYPVLPGFLVPAAYPTLDRIRAVTSPLFVVHGEQDRIVPASHGRVLYDAAPGPKRLLLVPDAGHNDLIARAGHEYTAALVDWLASLSS